MVHRRAVVAPRAIANDPHVAHEEPEEPREVESVLELAQIRHVPLAQRDSAVGLVRVEVVEHPLERERERQVDRVQQDPDLDAVAQRLVTPLEHQDHHGRQNLRHVHQREHPHDHAGVACLARLLHRAVEHVHAHGVRLLVGVRVARQQPRARVLGRVATRSPCSRRRSCSHGRIGGRGHVHRELSGRHLGLRFFLPRWM